jgi:hypothetical protein
MGPFIAAASEKAGNPNQTSSTTRRCAVDGDGDIYVADWETIGFAL